MCDNVVLSDSISREDAIDAIKFLPPYREYWKGTRKVLYKKEDIIKALKTLPPADVVSRENCDQCKTDQVGVLEQQLAELRGDYATLKKAYEDALADRQHAEWIEVCDTSRICSITRLKCSECGEEWLPDRTSRFNYCPCCGALMLKGGDTE